MHSLCDSTKIERMPSVMYGIIDTRRAHHSFRDSYRFDRTKSSIYRINLLHFLLITHKRINTKTSKCISIVSFLNSHRVFWNKNSTFVFWISVRKSTPVGPCMTSMMSNADTPFL
jgi:hypothetical protein